MSLKDHICDIQIKLKNNQYPNEQAISQGIVLRLLAALKWPVYDTQIVIPEYNVKGRRVDFALCIHRNKPVIFIEVKQPGNTLGADRQLFEYAFHIGVPFAIVTDGEEWHFYLPAEIGSYDERRVYKLDLVERDVQESAHQLNRYLDYDKAKDGTTLENAREDYKNISKERQATKNIPVAWKKLIEEKDDMLIEIISEKVESICGFKPLTKQVFTYLKILKPEYKSIQKTKLHWNNDKNEKGKIDHSIPTSKSSSTRGSGKISVKIDNIDFTGDSLRILYLNVLKYLVDYNKLDKLVLPWGTGTKRYIISKDRNPIHPSGKDFFVPVEYKGYTLESHETRKRGISLLKQLCLKLGLKFELIEV